MMPNLGEREGATGKKLRPQCESCKQDRVPFGKAVNATAIAQRKARIGSRHVAAHASASAQSMDEDVVIDHAAAAAAKKAAEVHAAAAAKAQADEAALGAAVPMQVQIQDGQEQLAKRQKPRRGYCLDVGVGGWYEGNVSEEVGVGTYKMNHDHYEAAAHVPRHRIVADEDILFITYEEVADPDPEQIFRCEVSIRDVGGEKDAVCLVNPDPEWERDEDGKVVEYYITLNARTQQQRESNPHWAHTHAALLEKLAALAAEAQPGTPSVVQ